MSRSGYNNDGDNIAMWRGQVASAIRGKRGQAFLIELIEALDALPEKRLITDALIEADGAVCAIGSVGLRRGVDMSPFDPDEPEPIAKVFGIAHQLVQEIEFENDERQWRYENGKSRKETPEERWARMRDWALSHIRDADVKERLQKEERS